MPKKRQQRALLIKPSSSKPVHFSNKSIAQTDAGTSTSTVNDLLREARRTNARITSREALTGSLPPAVREVLALPLPVPQPVRNHLRGPIRFRRIPGPPPPQSWLTSGHSESNTLNAFQQLRWTRARIQEEASNLPGLEMPAEHSLQHQTMKAIALNWSWHAGYDGLYLSSLPCNLRMLLLGYIAILDQRHFPNPMALLFPDQAQQENDNDLVTRLDLSNALGFWATTVRKIEKELIKNIAGSAAKQETVYVPETWDDTALPPEIRSHARFPNLKHLSLALDPTSSSLPPSWSSLISMTAHLSRLTSLSLAHWPTPTYTPNASRGRIKIVDNTGFSGPQSFGGTDMYSASDNDWREAAGILKSLSRNLYCLTWLDLSGCGSWLSALVWKDENDEYGPDWVGSWRNITALILKVGWTPGRPRTLEEFEASIASRSTTSVDSAQAIEQLYGHSHAIKSSLAQLSELRLNPPLHQAITDDVPWNVEHEREKQYFRREVERYNIHVETAQSVTREIREVRKKLGGKYLTVEINPRFDPSYADV